MLAQKSMWVWGSNDRACIRSSNEKHCQSQYNLGRIASTGFSGSQWSGWLLLLYNSFSQESPLDSAYLYLDLLWKESLRKEQWQWAAKQDQFASSLPCPAHPQSLYWPAKARGILAASSVSTCTSQEACFIMQHWTLLGWVISGLDGFPKLTLTDLDGGRSEHHIVA